MKIRVLFISTILFLCFVVSAKELVCRYDLTKQQVVYQEVLYNGDNLIWDFSDLDTIGTEYNVVLFMPDSTDLTCWSYIEHNTRYNYKIQNDTLLLLSYENPTSYIKYTTPEILLTYPIDKTEILQKEFSGVGEYGHLYPLSIKGIRQAQIQAVGTLKLLGVTYHDVFLLHSSRQYIQNGLDSVPIYFDLYQWFSPASNFPLFETIITTIKDKPDIQTSFIYKQPHIEEEKIDEYEKGLQRNSVITYLNCYPNPVATELYVNYALAEKSNVVFSVHNSLGLCVYKSSIEPQDVGDYMQSINFSNLMIGAYTLYIQTGGQVIEEVIIKK